MDKQKKGGGWSFKAIKIPLEIFQGESLLPLNLSNMGIFQGKFKNFETDVELKK